MKFISELDAGSRAAGIYLCKYRQSAVTKNGRPYDNVVLMDKTGTLNGKIWDPDSPGIEEFSDLDFIDVVGDVTNYNGALQISIKRARKAREGEYNPADYMPSTEKNIESMYHELCQMIESIQNPYLKQVLTQFFVEDQTFVRRFCDGSAAKSIHHGFIGGLLEHTLSVARLCDFYAESYPVLNRDLLLSAALLHDIGKVRELSAFPENSYTDEGQLLGHIVIGTEMIHDAIAKIPDFPPRLANELKHCVIAHHGELEYGSPKKPALAEALALSLADITDARMETLKELFQANEKSTVEWLGFNRTLESNVRKTTG
ncbi:MAG: HD domain-containing protein [Eubacterium sp.]|nr:HD domain-containing protein [Eubacterium sp.]